MGYTLPGFSLTNVGVGSNSQTNYQPQGEVMGPPNPLPVVKQIQNYYNPPAPPASQPVLGTKTSNNNNNSNGFDMKYYQGWDPKAAEEDWKATGGAKANQGVGSNQPDYTQAKANISASFDPIFQQLDQQAGTHQQWQQEQQGLIDQLYQSQQNELGVQRDNSINALNPETERINQEKARGIRGLQQGFENMQRSGNNYLGLSGAGDSSAAGMYNYALNKQVLRNTSDITMQAQKAHDAIGAKAQEIRGVYD